MGIFPLTGWQEHLLEYEIECLAKGRMLKSVTLGTSLLIKPALSMRRVERAFFGLCKRHDILRGQFRRLGGSWKFCIADAHPTGVTVHDYTGTAQDAVEGIIVQHTLDPLPMLESPLIALEVLRFGEFGDGLVLRLHHAIADGFSLLTIVEDLIKLMLGLPIFTPAVSHAAYLADWGIDAGSGNLHTEAYWKAKLLPPAKPLNLGRIKRELPMLENVFGWTCCKSLRFTLGKTDILPLEALGIRENASTFMLINAAFLQTIAQAGDCDDLLYSVTLGRSDAQMSHYAGHHTLHPLMRSRGLSDKSIGAVARDAAQELGSTMKHLANSAVRRSGRWDKELQAAGSYPRQITTGMLASNARTKLSPFAHFLRLKPGKPFDTGLFELRKVGLPQNAGDMDELNFRPNLDANGGTVFFNYDADAFDDAQIALMAEQVFAKVGIVPPESSLLKIG